ncbi:hypothetical protein FRC12_011340 [Ceratobasidium sp. 428]|nr:hypothetical protein FRC12_011340 [Ceratobasidium sp. 428]
MKEFLEKARGQQVESLDAIRFTEDEQAKIVQECRDVLKDKDADPSIIRKALADLLRVSDAREARATIMENDLDNLRQAIKEKTRPRPKNIRLGHARVWTQQEILEEREREARAQGSNRRGGGRGSGKASTGTQNKSNKAGNGRGRRRKADTADTESSETEFTPESEDSG